MEPDSTSVGKQKTIRDTPVKVMLTPEVRAKLDAVAANLGMSPSSVAAFAVANYAASQYAALGAAERAMEKVLEPLGAGLLELISKHGIGQFPEEKN